MAVLMFDSVAFSAENQEVLKNVSLAVEPGDFLSIAGPSGSGKSTFLKLCCNLISPVSGAIYYQNRNILEYEPTQLRREVAYCSQRPYLFGESVRENLEFPFKIRNSAIQQDRIDSLLHAVNLPPEIMDKDAENLSGGEKQRLALVRSLLFEPRVLLLDEVTASLDDENKQIIESLIKQLHQNAITILWVTHSVEQTRMADKLLTFQSGQVQSLEVIR